VIYPTMQDDTDPERLAYQLANPKSRRMFALVQVKGDEERKHVVKLFESRGAVVLPGTPCWYVLAANPSTSNNERLAMQNAVLESESPKTFSWKLRMFGLKGETVDWAHTEICEAMKRLDRWCE